VQREHHTLQGEHTTLQRVHNTLQAVHDALHHADDPFQVVSISRSRDRARHIAIRGSLPHRRP
jgi:hypothetical protein